MRKMGSVNVFQGVKVAEVVSRTNIVGFNGFGYFFFTDQQLVLMTVIFPLVLVLRRGRKGGSGFDNAVLSIFLFVDGSLAFLRI